MNAFVSTFAISSLTCKFAGTSVRAGLTAGRTSSSVAMINATPEPTTTAPAPAKAVVMSQSVPFLNVQSTLDPSLPGYVGFDPLAVSKILPINYLAEAEIKHGRICMLAIIGILVQECVQIPGEVFSNPVATEALTQVPVGGLWQIFFFCGILEFILHKGKISVEDMFEDESRIPGEMGFDPLKLGKNPAAMAKYRINEIKNGRLAMCGVGGFIHQMFVTKQPIIYQLTHFKPVSF